MSTRILLLGATGYTGGRTAEALVARGARPVLGGRDPERLETAAARFGGLDTVLVDTTDRRSVDAAIRQGDVIVNTVGPFGRLGAPVVEAAVASGAIYLDSTGEAPFIREVFTRHGGPAEAFGATLLPAFGSDWVPGNLAGALALQAAGNTARPIDTLQIGYFLGGSGLDGPGRALASRGTVSSMFEMALDGGYRYVDGRIVTEAAAARIRAFGVAGRNRSAVSVGGTEQFALPRLLPSLARVDVFLGWFGRRSASMHAAAPAFSALGRLPGARAAVSALGRAVTSRMPETPDPGALQQVRSIIVAEAFDRYGTLLAAVTLDGPEPYAMTADLLAWAAVRAADEGVRDVGAVGPVEAFGLEPLLDGARSAGLAVTSIRTAPQLP